MKKLTLLIITLLLLSSCWKEEIKEVHKYYDTAIVQSWSINTWENYIWYTEGITEVTLSTKSSWKITYLKSKIWDKISVWELLASLDSSEAKVWYNTAKNIISSLDSIKNYTSLSYDEQIKVIQKKIEEIKQSQKSITNNTSNLENLKNTELDSWILLVKQAQTQLETSKIELEEATNIFNWKKEDIYKSWKNTITNNIILSTNIIYFTDELLWITKENKDKNDDFDDYLGTKDRNILNSTIKIFKETNIIFLEYQSYYEKTIENKKPSNEEIIIWLEKGLLLSEKLKVLLNLLYKTIDNSIENVYLTLNTINSYKEKVSNYWNQIENQILSVNWNISSGLRWTSESLNSLEREYTKDINLLKKKINISEDYLESTIQNLEKIKAGSLISTDNEESKKDILIKQIEWLLAQIESIKAEKNAKLKEVDSSITEIRWEKSLAWVQIQNWNIYSPISWIIIRKFSEIWEISSAWNPIYIVWDDSKIKIKIEIPEKILNEISVWKKVNIIFEKIDKILIWEIINIPAIKNSITKKTTIEIVINNPDKEIKIWTIAKVSIPVSNKIQKWIIIPNSAILQQYSIPWVYILENSKARFIKIEIISQNEYFSEIKWVNIWKIIITDWKENIWDGEFLK